MILSASRTTGHGTQLGTSTKGGRTDSARRATLLLARRRRESRIPDYRSQEFARSRHLFPLPIRFIPSLSAMMPRNKSGVFSVYGERREERTNLAWTAK